MTGSMVDVDRSVLVDKLRKQRARIIDEHVADVASYPDQLAAWIADTATKLETLAAQVRIGRKTIKVERGYAGSISIGSNLIDDRPAKPSSVKDATCRIDRMIATVELVKTEAFKLRTDDPILVTALGDKC